MLPFFVRSLDVNKNLPAPTTERPLSQVENYELDAVTSTAPRVIQQLQESADEAARLVDERRAEFDRATTPDDMTRTKAALDEAEESASNIQAELNARKNEYDMFKREADLRKADQAAIDAMDDPYALPKNLWTDSVFYKFVTTPMKRVLQDTGITDNAKKIILGIAGDSGILLNMHRGGLRLGPSVYQKASMRDGEWVQVYDELRNIYGAEFGKGKQTFLDYDIGGITQKVAEKVKTQPENMSFQQYITELNKKRMRGEAASTDAESRGMKLLDDFYETWEKRLNQTGLIGNQAFYKNKSILLEGDIAKRQAIIDDLKAKKNRTASDEDRLAHNQRMLGRLKDQKEDIDLQIKATQDFPATGNFAEKFHPRYWLKDQVESRRADLHRILTEWYQKNPYVYVLNEKTGKYQRVRTDPNTAGKRADETIDKILGLDDVTAEGNALWLRTLKAFSSS